MYKTTIAYSHWYSAHKKHTKAKVKKDNAIDKVKTRSGKCFQSTKSIYTQRVQCRGSCSHWVRCQEDEDSEDEDKGNHNKSDEKDEDEDRSDCDCDDKGEEEVDVEDDDKSDELDMVPWQSFR